jgi:hypothetical protein
MPLPLEHYSGSALGPVLRLYSWRTSAPSEIKWVYRRINRGSLPDAPGIVEHWAGMIEGTVTVQSMPARSRVVALDTKGLTPKLHTFSDPVTGHFRLYPLVAGPRRYLVMAQDAKTRFNAVVYDGVETVPWEDEE